MAHVEDRWHRKTGERTPEYGKGKRWRARYSDPDGKPHAPCFDRKVDAERHLQSVGGDMLKGTYIDPRAGDITVREYAKTWLAAQQLADTSRVAYAGHLDRDIVPALGDYPLRLLRPTPVQAWVTSLTVAPRGLAPSTAAAVFNVLRIVMRAAVRDQLIARSPCDGVRTAAAPERTVELEDLLTLAQVLAWDAAMPEAYRGMVVVAASTGLRQGELLGLRVDGPDPDNPRRQLRRVDLTRREIRVVEQIQTPAKGQPYYCPPKTAKGRRRIPINDVTVAAINAHLALQPVVDGEPIFRTTTGARFRRPRFREVWAAAATVAGLPPGTHWHQLRDFYASALIAGGCDIKVVMERLGHASAEETLRTYARLWPDSDDRTRTAVDLAFKPKKTASKESTS